MAPANTNGGNAHILIAGINYAPEETGNAPYTTGLAEYLASVGYDVTVLTGMPYYPEWKVAPEYERRLRMKETVNGVLLKRFRTYIPGKQTAIHRLGFEAGFFFNGVLPGKIRRPDVILGIVPSLGGAGLASVMSKRFGVPYGLLFQDLVGAAASQSGMPGGGKVAKFVQSLEGRWARNAAGVAIISEGFRPYLLDLGVAPERIIHQRNWSHVAKPTRPASDVRRELGWKDDESIVLHAGAMGLKQGLENVIDSARIAQSTSPGIRFVLMGDGNQRSALVERASDLKNVTFLPPCSSDDFPNILGAADQLLINERASLKDMALPSKLTSYLVAGRPIVAAVSSEGETSREIGRTGAGIAVPAGNPEALVSAIIDLVNNPARAEQLGSAGPRYAKTTLRADVVLRQAESFVQSILNTTQSAYGVHAS